MSHEHQTAESHDRRAEASRWHLAAMLLSMDAAAPLWVELRVPVAPSATIRSIFREAVRAHRRAENDDDLTTSERLVRYAALREGALERVADLVGDEIASDLALWFAFFPFGDEADVSAFLWRRLLRRLADLGNQAFPLAPLELPKPQADQLISAIRSHLGDAKELENRILELETALDSEWDRNLAATYRGGSIFDWAANVIEFYRTRDCWSAIEEALSEAQLATLLDWARAQAELMEMDVFIGRPNFAPATS